VIAAPQAQASGWILIDPIIGAPPIMPVTPVTVTPLTPVRPTTRPGPRRPLLTGQVSYGLHLKAESVNVVIKDQVAKTYISQTFENDTDRNLAGTYMFPLPDDTTFSSFSLHIDGKPVEGKILEANAARQQYEEIVRRMVDPGLLEYADYKTVRARIFPIPAHGTKKVELEYTQLLKGNNGMVQYRFPLKAKVNQEPAEEIKIDVKLESERGLRTIWSPSHAIGAERPSNNLAKISMVEKNSLPDKDFLLYYNVSDKDMSASLVNHRKSGENGYFLLTLSPPVKAKSIIGKDVVLVADTSGSMVGEKMEQNKKALKYVIDALHPSDRFGLVNFSTDAEPFKSKLVAATPENKRAAKEFVDELEARGGTNIGDAIAIARTILEDGATSPAYLILMTDGEPTVGERDTTKLIKLAQSTRDIRVFDFGVGYDINTRLLDKLASSHHGTSQYVDPDENLETAISAFYDKIKSPVLTDVKLTYEGVVVKDVYPKDVKDIFAGSQVLLLGRYKDGASANLKLTGKVNGVTKAFSFPLKFEGKDAGNSHLSRLWAMRRIGYLTEVAQANGDSKEVVDEIIALSKKHGIISAYTSYLVTDPSENQRLVVNQVASRPGMRVPSPSPRSAGRPSSRLIGAADGAMLPPPPAAPALAVAPSISRGFSASEAIVVRGALMSDFRKSARRREADEIGRMGGGAGGGMKSMSKDERFDRALHSVRDKMNNKQKSVVAAKAVGEMKATDTLAYEPSSGERVKMVSDKTFYLKNGFWTESSCLSLKGNPQKVITFGTKAYFDLLSANPGMSKYLSVGKQAIFEFAGVVYKIVQSRSATAETVKAG
ncbi:MAG: VIT and VWA domain-containing protein, partial [Candidatus Obscuribacterales bacterium]|nr:VIT and VWA domain-containing protein [Candidatus Obscuribacterales bacterium]